jgi:hypothetical protein
MVYIQCIYFFIRGGRKDGWIGRAARREERRFTL